MYSVRILTAMETALGVASRHGLEIVAAEAPAGCRTRIPEPPTIKIDRMIDDARRWLGVRTDTTIDTCAPKGERVRRLATGRGTTVQVVSTLSIDCRHR